LLGTPTWPPCLCHFIPLGITENQEYECFLRIQEGFGMKIITYIYIIFIQRDLRRRLSPNKTPRPSSQNSMANREETDSPIKLQLQKLVDKEEARLESERKQAAAERRRKAQQEKFLAQHALSHPLRDHHQREQERLRTARGKFFKRL
jgi:hypothetical protein